MAHKEWRHEKQPRKGREQFDQTFDVDSFINYKTVRPVVGPLEAKTENQARLIAAIDHRRLIFTTGAAGTGKTYIAVAKACEALASRQIDRIVITRPAQEAGESMGFLPGELEDKFEPYIRPLRDIFEERMGKSQFAYALKSKKIEAIPLAYMRGLTFARTWVLLDEAQNTTPKQMKMFLTRLGEDSKVIVNGDISQVDISGPSGLEHAISVVGFIPSVAHIHFNIADVVRDGLCQEIVQAYYDKAPSV